MTSKKILLSTWPFASTGSKPLDLLKQTNLEIVHNPFHRRLKASDLVDMLEDIDAVIAGTEPYNSETLRKANRLKAINRVGIGLDSIDLEYCRDNDIQVTYTPDAPSQAVAELTVANILNLFRHIHRSHKSVCEGAWNRYMGRLLQEIAVGVIGVGRIGSRVIRLLEPFRPTILAIDKDPEIHGKLMPNTRWCSIDEIISKSDLITIHIPMCSENYHFVNRSMISKMKTGSFIINTSRGGLVDTESLTDALAQNHLGGVALDVFEDEPYEGSLTKFDNVVLTAHIAASARKSRYLMELSAAEDCVRVLNSIPPDNDAIKDTLG